MHGVSDRDPSCIRTMSEMIDYINEVGFLPLFKNEETGWTKYRVYDWKLR